MRMILTAGMLCAALLVAVVAAVHADHPEPIEPAATTVAVIN